MRTKLLLLSLTAALAVAMLFFASSKRSARRDAERDTESQRRLYARLMAEAGGIGHQLAAAESERVRVTAALDAVRRNPAGAAAGPTRPAKPAPPEVAALREGIEDGPKIESRLLAETRVRIAENYGPLVRQLHLTEAQSAQFVENLLKRYEDRMDFSLALGKLPPAAGDDAVANTGRQRIDEAFRAAQTALLGPVSYEKFDFYDRTGSLRRFVDDFAGKSTIAGAPIAGGQADALLAAMATSSPHFQRGQIAPMENIDWTAVLARAATELSEPQLAVFMNAAILYWNKDRLRELGLKK